MADSTYWQLEKEYYAIATDHDLVLRIIEHMTITRTEGEGDAAHDVTESVMSKVHEYKVKREAMSASSVYFANLLSDANIEEGQQDTIELQEDGITAMTVWLKVIHGTADDLTYKVSIDDLWHMLAMAEKYNFTPGHGNAKAWFEKWYAVNTSDNRMFDYKEHQTLLLPCHSFDHAPGFQRATRYLVYRATGNVSERRPHALKHEHDTLQLNPSIATSLNAAKARLKTVLHRALYNPIDDLLRRARCRCKAEVLYAYEVTLMRTGAWPLETTFLMNSVEYTLRKLESVQPRVWQPQNCGSRFCAFEFGFVVGKARDEVKKLFDGLCLDCMMASDAASGEDANGVYWSKTRYGVQWDKGCRVRHGQPTWYFSFTGQRAKMNEWVEGRRNSFYGGGNSSGRGSIAAGPSRVLPAVNGESAVTEETEGVAASVASE
ncbi:hypothetical protein LTR53_011534 [Teratosphaeriaceae sp. CCFEE 6253]|nr:hypothetical protein LTR53_011534 [Teratosphaeriaceae sp. CCFEE 6253]